MAINQCLLCDKTFESPSWSVKWCKECRKKQQEIKREKSKKKKFSLITPIKFKQVSKVCEYCKIVYSSHKPGMQGILRRFCSRKCQLKWEREYNFDFVKGRKKKTKTNISSFESTSALGPVEYLTAKDLE